MSTVFSLLKDLIQIPSPSGREEQICQFVFDFLEKNDFSPIKIADEISGFNILVKVGCPKVYLSAHLDTVPTPLELKETKTQIIGRGACDTKGSAASMIMAAIKAKEKSLTNFGLIFTVGEETDFRGAKKIMETKEKIPFVIVGEPTDLKIVNGHFGLLEFKLVAQGKSAHSSDPRLGVNAIDKLVTAINQVQNLKLSPDSSSNLGLITGGKAVNIIPDQAEASFGFRIDPKDNRNYVEEIARVVGDLAKVEKKLEINSVYTEVPPELNFIKERKVARYCTELSYFKTGVVLGPGETKYAHSEDEQVEKADLEKAVEIYLKILQNFA